MCAFSDHLHFTLDIAKDFIPALYEYYTNNFIVYAINKMSEEERNGEYAQFLIHKAIKDFEELKQLAEVLSI